MKFNCDYLLVDGTNIVYRCFYAIKMLTNETIPVNAIYGFVNTIWSIEQRIDFKNLLVFFDCGKSTKRTTLLPTYKINRKTTPEELKIQLPYIKQIVSLLGGCALEKIEIEADDLLGSWAHYINKNNKTGIIVSADKDFMQCINDNIRQFVPKQNEWQLIDSNGVFENIGITPTQVVDFLSLVGDSADNFDGICGVGPKIAATWLSTYGNIENILLNLSTLKPDRFRQILESSKEKLDRNKQLAELDINEAYVDKNVTNCSKLKTNELIETFDKLNLNQLSLRAKSKYLPQKQLELF